MHRRWLSLLLALMLLSTAPAAATSREAGDVPTVEARIQRIRAELDDRWKENGGMLSHAHPGRPAYSGQPVEVVIDDGNLRYTVRTALLGFSHGAESDWWPGDAPPPEPSREGYACVVAIFYAYLLRVEPLEGAVPPDEAVLGIDLERNFALYALDGTRYDVPLQTYSDLPTVSSLREGESTTGYIFFEMPEDEYPPFLVFSPIPGKEEIWLRVQYWSRDAGMPEPDAEPGSDGLGNLPSWDLLPLLEEAERAQRADS